MKERIDTAVLPLAFPGTCWPARCDARAMPWCLPSAAIMTSSYSSLIVPVPSAGPSAPAHPQWTMFFHDPSGNALEFKAMTNPDNLFAKYTVTD